MSEYTPVKLSHEQVAATLREVVAERPEYVYESPSGEPAGDGTTCFYVHHADDGTMTPGCLVGVVLNRLGVPLEELAKHEGRGAHPVARELADVDYRAVDMLWAAQDRQDDGATWATALESAERYAPLSESVI